MRDVPMTNERQWKIVLLSLWAVGRLSFAIEIMGVHYRVLNVIVIMGVCYRVSSIDQVTTDLLLQVVSCCKKQKSSGIKTVVSI